MKRILLTTLFATLLGSIIVGLLFLFESPGTALYIVFLTFGNIVIPTLLGVLLFQIIRKKVAFENQTKTVALRILILILVFTLVFIIWAIADVGFLNLNFKNIADNLNLQFSGFTLIALSLAIAIPAIDVLIDGKIKKQNSIQKNVRH